MWPRQPIDGWRIWWLATAGLAVYWLCAADATERRILAHTLALSVSSAVGAVVLGCLWAYALWGRAFWQVGLRHWAVAATVMPLFLHLSIWDAAIGKLGWITADTNQLFVPMVPRWLAAWWVHATAAAPAIGWLLVATLRGPRPIIEQQALLEMSARQVFWSLTTVRLRPVLWAGALWALLVAAREIAVTDLYQIGTLAEQIYLGFSLAQPERSLGNQQPEFWQASWGLYAATIGWLAVSGVAFIWSAQRMIGGTRRQGHGCEMPQRATGLQSLVGWSLIGLFVFVPVMNLILRGCLVVVPVNGQPQVQYHVSALFASLGRVLRDYSDSLFWSGQIAFWGGIVSMSLGLILAWQARRRVSVRWGYWIIAGLTLALPGPLIGLAYFQIFDLDWGRVVNRILDRTLLLPVLATMTYCWPLVAVVCWFAVHEVPPSLLESAELDGVPAHAQLWTLLIRGSWPRLAGWLVLIMAWMFGELSAGQMVLPPGIDTVPRLMLGFLHAGVDELTAVMGLVLGCGWLLATWVGQGIVRLNNRRQVT